MRKMLVGLMLLLCASSAFAGTYLYGFTPGGALGGGIRFDLKPGVVTDLSLMAANGSAGTTYTLYGDIFWGNWGIGADIKQVAVGGTSAFDINLQYAVEQAINEEITVGIGITLINYDTTTGLAQPLTIMPAVAPYFVLAL